MKFLRSIALILLVLPLVTLAANAQDEIDLDSIKTLLQGMEGEEHFRLLINMSENTMLETSDRLGYAEDAVDYALDMEETEYITEAYISLGNVLARGHENEDAIEAYQDAYEAGEEGDHIPGMAEGLARIGSVYINMQEKEQAEDYLQRARVLVREGRDLAMEARIVYWMGDVHFSITNDLAAAMAYYEEALPIARESEDRQIEGNILSDMGLVHYYQGNFMEAIVLFQPTAPLFRETGMEYDEARIYILLANANFQLARYDVALGHYQDALSIFEKINSSPGIAAVLNGMALVYFSQNFYDKALEMHFQKLELSRNLGDEYEIGYSLNNIGNTYSMIASDTLTKMFGPNFADSVRDESTDKYLEYFTDALGYYQQALEVWEEIDNQAEISGTLYNLGLTYLNSGRPDLAEDYLERAMIMNRDVGNQRMQADLLLRMGQLSLSGGNLSQASRYLHQSLDLAQELDIKNTLEYVYLNLSDLYAKLRNFEQSLIYYKEYSGVKDTMNQKEKMDMISEMQVKYETDAIEKDNALLVVQTELAEADLRQTRVILIFTVIAIGVFLLLVVQLLRQNNLKKKANRELAASNALITEQKKEITDSIEYASRIQDAMLPPGDYIDKLLPERFIIFMPRDIVSGDYYYITEKDNKVICVAADCTGHGVPGAFMSMLGIAFLNEIISKQAELHTDEMLGELRAHVIKNLHQTGKEGESQDGMDLALYIADMNKMSIEFSGANNSLFLFRNGEMIEAKADKMPIGIHTRAGEPFTRHNLDLKKGDMLYTFSDGYPDQFGGPNQKKFMIKKFKALLADINTKSMEEQKNILESTLADWMAETSQVDDILVIGVRI